MPAGRTPTTSPPSSRPESPIILLLSCYEGGQQPLGLAVPLGFMRLAGLPAVGLDLSVEKLAPERIDAAELVGIGVPMHTALRIGGRAARQIRQRKPVGHFDPRPAARQSQHRVIGARNDHAALPGCG